MDNSAEKFDVTGIHKCFGPTVVKYMKENNILPQKDFLGSYALPNNHDFILKKWNPASFPYDSRKKKVRIRPVIDPYKPETHDLDGEDNFRIFVNFRGSKDIKLISKPAPSTNREKLTISQLSRTVETEKKIIQIVTKNLNGIKSRTHRRVARPFKREEIFRIIIDTRSPEHHHCASSFIPICKIFAKRHLRFQYNIILESIPQDTSLSDGQLSLKQIYEFLAKIIYHVVPKDLFGNRRNNKKIKRTLKRYIELGSEDFTLQSLVQSLNVDSIKWLDNVHNKVNKIYLMSQVVDWFFDKFIWHIIYSFFYIEKSVSSSHEKLLFRRWVKRGSILQYTLDQVHRNVYKPISKDAAEQFASGRRIAKLRLHTKISGIRPVLIAQPDETRKKECKIIQKILKQLYLTDNPPQKPHVTRKIWEAIHKYRKRNPDKPLYFISCDINDAYGSIIQEKLLEIVFELVDRLPNKLISQWIAMIKPTKIIATEMKKVECIGFEDLPPLLPRGSLYCTLSQSSRPRIGIKKESIKKFIENAILKQVIRVGKKYFILKQGVGQGLSLSAILNEIYYKDMESKELARFAASGHLFRYVDDFVYLTGDKKLAKEFLEMAKNGLRNYNCTFNNRKTQSNLSPYNKKEFVFLGYSYNIETMDAKPEYSNKPLRYILALNTDNKIKERLYSLFIYRISTNLEWLKLFSFVLDPCINSKETVLNTLKKAACMLAEKCFLLLINMYDFKSMDREMSYRIFRDIKTKSIQPLLRICSQTLRKKRGRFKIELEELKSIFWSEYLKMFRKNPVIYRHFSTLLKNQLKSE